MLQARIPGAPEWYRPDRDFLQAMLTILRLSVTRVTEQCAPDHTERLGKVAQKLARLTNQCRDHKVTADELKEVLCGLRMDDPDLFKLLAEESFITMYELYRTWSLEILPQKPDGTIDYAKTTTPDGKP